MLHLHFSRMCVYPKNLPSHDKKRGNKIAIGRKFTFICGDNVINENLIMRKYGENSN